MTKRKKNVVFVPFDDDEYQFYVWSDLKESDFAKVEGISRVVEGYGGPNQACVFADPRYDVAEVQAEIEALAEQQGARWRVTVSNGQDETEFFITAPSRSAATLKAEKRLRDKRLISCLWVDFEITDLVLLDY